MRRSMACSSLRCGSYGSCSWERWSPHMADAVYVHSDIIELHHG